MTARPSPLTPREQNCLALIAAFDLVENRSPSLDEIAKGCGLKHKRTAALMVDRLRRQGLLNRDRPTVKGGRTRSGGIQISQGQTFPEASTQP